MIRQAIATGLVAAVGCSHPSSLASRHSQPSVAVDSNFVSGDELWEDARQGHTDLYDALKSTRPEILRAETEGLHVYVDRPWDGAARDRLPRRRAPDRVEVTSLVATRC